MKALTVCLMAIPWLVACGRGEEPRPAAAETPTDEYALEDAEAGGGRDLSEVNVCDLLPADAVAAAAGGETSAPAEPTDPGFSGKGCRYEYRLSGLRQTTNISLHPPSDFDFQRTIQTFELHDLPQLGDAAIWGKRTGQTVVYMLKERDVTVHIEANGQNLDQAQAIARVVLERL